jgi:hypothetical protein
MYHAVPAADISILVRIGKEPNFGPSNRNTVCSFLPASALFLRATLHEAFPISKSKAILGLVSYGQRSTLVRRAT